MSFYKLISCKVYIFSIYLPRVVEDINNFFFAMEFCQTDGREKK